MSSVISRAAWLGGSAAAILASAARPQSTAADLIPLRVGVPPTDATGEGFYGVDKGFYKDAGLDVTLSTMFNGAAMNAALAAGSLDIITGTVVPVATSPVKTAADLNGKTVAVNGLGDLTHLALLQWLGSNGADVKSVKLIEVAFPAVGPALDQGRIDAALLVEPFTTALKGKVRIIGDTMPGIGPRFIGTVWVGKLSWLAQNRDAAQRFAAATLKIAAWANANNAESATILSHYTNMSVATINSLTPAVYDTSPATGALLQPVIDAQIKYFGIPKITGANLIWP